MMRHVFSVFGALALLLGGPGCARRAPLSYETPAASASAASASSTLGPRRASLPVERGASLYELDLKLVDQRGSHLRFDAFRGHPVIVSMFYGSCPFACPTLLSDVRSIERRLSPEVRADLRVLLVSLDPEHDTPAALFELEKTRGLDPSRWTLASASDDSVRELAAVLGIKYRKLAKGGFNHTSLITLLDRDGTPLARSEGLQGTNDEIVAALAGSS